ncbi:hypothetical protein SAMN05421771_3412 [Granulicella pectinivorans]|jgi:uncharacterized membrane protein (UPF0127 family)|uniref:DUF192 domain-containing protein n=1 Tax=Granulicella pectinivorans TaxID=474950 RepID=A0A1I6MRZ1_9BACT|nr:DUF192 domain-containing protein [Granulicella pectinivorans]SFS18288.1 hypothetical protein SAMN05421771_3412 [Granulicella pectinivorans]
MRRVQIIDKGRNTVIAGNVGVADHGFARMRGLLGRKSLDAGEGLWIRPSSGIHTFGMSFPIDVVGLNASLTVTKLWKNVKPQRMTTLKWNVRSVIELQAGLIESSGLKLGDQVLVKDYVAESEAR